MYETEWAEAGYCAVAVQLAFLLYYIPHIMGVLF